jgi:hypothetical protein
VILAVPSPVVQHIRESMVMTKMVMTKMMMLWKRERATETRS